MIVDDVTNILEPMFLQWSIPIYVFPGFLHALLIKEEEVAGSLNKLNTNSNGKVTSSLHIRYINRENFIPH
jgi:hypothetical protein